MSRVSVIIVTSDHDFCIEKCVKSVLDSESYPQDIVVVDNDSQDQTPAILASFGNKIRVINRQGRHSLSNNINVALAAVSADHVYILNPDIVLQPGSTTQLSQFLDEHPTSGAAAPGLVFPDGSLQLSCRRFPTPWSTILRRTPLRVFLSYEDRGKAHLMTDIDHTRDQHVDWVLGAAIMFRMAALRSIGLFDERYRLYCEDIDTCFGLWQQGWSVDYVPGVRVAHEHRAVSDKKLFSKHSMWHYRSMLQYFQKHGTAGFKRPSMKSSPKEISQQVHDA